MSNKKPDIFLIISIAAACLIVVGAIVFTMMRHPSAPAADSTLSGMVVVPMSLRKCARNDTCMMVDQTCNACHGYVAINSRNEDVFNQLFNDACEKFKGDPCPASEASVAPACIRGTCQLIGIH